ncbi:MAG: hypothetical protein H6742_22315, partial [Alphaproteobacteria bacterium]|nr:hypothetical protein [Alphaproteobacteria bacterium]
MLASGTRRRANVLMAPFAGLERVDSAGPAMRELETMVGLSKAQKAQGWRIALVAQVGTVSAEEAALDGFDDALCRKLGANLLALRSERIQPGVNQEEKAPAQYHERQAMDVPDRLAFMAGRAGYNGFAHWTGLERQQAKDLLILDRIDPLTDQGKERLRAVRRELELVTDRVVDNLPLWADLPTGKALSRNAARGKKAFALAGQRIYVGGLSRDETAAAGIGWEHAVRAFGAAAARSSLTAELAGCAEIPDGCDLLAGICLMAGPVNQNDIGKQFYGMQDLLSVRHPHRDPTSLLVWTLKAKTVADPIGNEEQLLNPARKGALVDLRLAPHECCRLAVDGGFVPMRKEGDRTCTERAFHDQGNFITDGAGREIPGNRGEPWPREWG